MSNPEANSYNPRDHMATGTTLTNPVAFTIIHVDDITKSKMAKLEEWQRYKDPNEVGVDRLNGRIIREINEDDGGGGGTATNGGNGGRGEVKGSVYKLTLKDNFDNYCFAYEYNDQLPFLRTGSTAPIPIQLGGKLIVNRGTLVSNGALLLTRSQCSYLGVDTNSGLVKALNSNLVEKSIDILQNPDL